MEREGEKARGRMGKTRRGGGRHGPRRKMCTFTHGKGRGLREREGSQTDLLQKMGGVTTIKP